MDKLYKIPIDYIVEDKEDNRQVKIITIEEYRKNPIRYKLIDTKPRSKSDTGIKRL
jgi:hypothetical protein